MAPRLLGEILQDQQEPFTLQLYLLEKGYKDCRASSINKNKKMLAVPKIFGSILNKIASMNPRIKNPDAKIQDFGVRKNTKRARQEHKHKRSSYAGSSITAFRSCSRSDIEGMKSFTKQRTRKVPAEKILPSTYEDENKQQSPVSVLQVAVLSGETSPDESRKNTNETIASSDQSSQYNKIKIALQQTRQLLFDCMKDIETQVMSKRKVVTRNQSQFRDIAGSENLGKVMSRHRTKSTPMLLTLDKWSSLEEQKKEIAMDIADFILQDMTNFVVQQMT